MGVGNCDPHTQGRRMRIVMFGEERKNRACYAMSLATRRVSTEPVSTARRVSSGPALDCRDTDTELQVRGRASRRILQDLGGGELTHEAMERAIKRSHADIEGVAISSVQLEAGRVQHEGDLELLLPVNVERRAQLRSNPEVQSALSRLWTFALASFDTDGSQRIDAKGYRALHGKVVATTNAINIEQGMQRSLISKADQRDLLAQDWRRDTAGREDYLSESSFGDSMFELVDLWCDSLQLQEYLGRLHRYQDLLAQGAANATAARAAAAAAAAARCTGG